MYTIENLKSDIADGNGLPYYDRTPREDIVGIFKKHARNGREITKNCIEAAMPELRQADIKGMTAQGATTFKLAIAKKIENSDS